MTPENIAHQIKEDNNAEFRQVDFWTTFDKGTTIKIVYDYEPGLEVFEEYIITKVIQKEYPQPTTVKPENPPTVTLHTKTGNIGVKVSDTVRYASALTSLKCQEINYYYHEKGINNE